MTTLKNETRTFFNQETLNNTQTFFKGDNFSTTHNQKNVLKDRGHIYDNTINYKAQEQLNKMPTPFFRRHDFTLLQDNKNFLNKNERAQYERILQKERMLQIKYSNYDIINNVSGVVHQTGNTYSDKAPFLKY
jgi:hypothetical protein